jgi:hypothetical protein
MAALKTYNLEPQERGFDDVSKAAALCCAIGFFIRILFSAPLLNVLGIDYGGEDTSFFVKIHPGSYFIVVSFLILIFSTGNPVERLIHIIREQTAFFIFVAVYVLIVIYWTVRGPKGVGLILDVQIIAPIAAIVFSYAPISYCRRIVYLFASIAVFNSVVGIVEAATHTRLFTFDPTWEVLQQDYFRSSAIIGHPLANAVFTVVALFVILSMRMPTALKSVVFLIMIASLVAFGSRSGLGMCAIGLTILGLIEIKKYLSTNQLSVMQLIIGAGAILIVPLVSFGLIYIVLHGSLGERLLAYNSLNDESAEVRMMVFRVFNYMTPSDFIFGSDGDHTLDIANRVGLKNPTSDIENPWILMFMFLGALMFVPWFGALVGYVLRLMSGASPAIKLAVLEYFAVTSTSNSFGRKDLIFGMLGGIIVCVKRMQAFDNRQEENRE